MSFYQKKNTTYPCCNCGKPGHIFRYCSEPVSSYGALIFRRVDKDNLLPILPNISNTDENGMFQLLMIQRKNTLGFMDIMRGKYKLKEPDYIRKQIRNMTEAERAILATEDFEKIWHDLWGADTESAQRYAHDRIISRDKLAELRAGIELPSGEKISLDDILRQEPIMYKSPEWGFPKGRRDPNESDMACAFRELQEETGIMENDILKLGNIAPLVEQFYGSNNIHYRHTYYLGQYVGKQDILFDETNLQMTREISSLAWKTIDEAIMLIRPENIEKRNMVIQLNHILSNYIPIMRPESVGIKTQKEQYGTQAKSDRINRLFKSK
ncbi:MAG: NUDIX domain-containing protein [Alphaproteobacteria bacterium]|nr:NUDIX domain-containing protein [Alphaproteobacteria bacterium]